MKSLPELVHVNRQLAFAFALAQLFEVGCGRIGFAVHDGGGTAMGDGPDADLDLPGNRVFVTSGVFPATLGGLSGADNACQFAASVAGLQGTFVALLSSSTVNAPARLAGSRGWRRPDGLVAFDSIDDAFVSGQMFAPVDLDEHGRRVSHSEYAWTGTSSTGTPSGSTCTDWTAGSSVTPVNLGLIGSGLPTFVEASSSTLCGGSFHLYCFETGHSDVLGPRPPPAGARLIFLSQDRTTAGLTALDDACAQDAAGAGYAGSYKAVVATTTSSIASRFVDDGRPIYNLDGVLVARNSAQLFGQVELEGSVTRRADGRYVGGILGGAFGGAASPTTPSAGSVNCQNWTSISGANMGELVSNSQADGKFWGTAVTGCNSPFPTLCLEE